MSRLNYLGGKVGLIHSLPYDYTYNGDNSAWKRHRQETIKIIKENSNFGLIAITADFYQTKFHGSLKELGFEKVFTFKSSHNAEGENLTLWVKVNKEAKNPKKIRIMSPPFNCSVSFNQGFGRKLDIYTKKPKGVKYRKIRNINVWYVVDKADLR